MKLLQQLQDLDLELNDVRKESGKLEAEQASVAADLDRVQAMVDSLTADMDILKVQRREEAEALEREKENVKKAEGRLPAIKTQKEYVAVLKEIDMAKKLNKEIEDRIKQKDGEIDVLSRDKQEKEEELAAMTEKVSSRRSEVETRLAECGRLIDEKTSERGALLKQLPVSIQKRYQVLIERRGGVAIVKASQGTCTGCNMNLPPQLYNSLFRLAEIQTCPHCNRLLYVTDEG